MFTPAVACPELSKSSKRVAETLDQAQRVHITRRAGGDLCLTTARHDQPWEETAGSTAPLCAPPSSAATPVSGPGVAARVLADPELTAHPTRRLPDEDRGEVTAL